jgi:Ca2+-binding EF-hand superfamily protein
MGSKQSSSLPPQIVEELEESTSFTYSEVNDLYRQFRRDCPTQQMTVAQFKKLYQDTFPSGKPDDFAERVFKTYDVDARGYIDFKQFLTTLNAQLKGGFEDKLRWLFGLYDTDSSGFITRDDILCMINSLHELTSETIETEEQLSINEIVEHVMKHADRSQNGKIGLQDFLNSALTSNTLATLLQKTIRAADSPYIRRKERRGSIGIPLHHHQQHLHPSSASAVDRRGSRDSEGRKAPAGADTRRASLTPNMLDFNAMVKQP